MYLNRRKKGYVRITFTDDNGKRRNIKRTALSKSEANQILSDLINKLETTGKEAAINFHRSTFNDLADYYEEHYAKPAVIVDGAKIEGLKDYKSVRYFLLSFRESFGKRKLTKITYNDLVSYRSYRLKQPTAKKKTRTISSMNKELAYLKRIFNIALRKGWIEKNPFSCGESLIQISHERRRTRVLSSDEEARLLSACEHPQRRHLKSLLIALLDTGARKGEMLKLIWNDVDLENGLISIQASNSKTLKHREIALTKRLANELSTRWESTENKKSSLVFGIKSNVRKSFSTACRIAGIKEGGIDGISLHSLRHTAATRLVNGNLPIQMVGRILGHTQPQTTYRYLTADTGTLREAASILERIQPPNNCSKIG